MTLNTTAILDAVVSHALSTGLFERVNTHEPKQDPGNGLSVAIWADRINPVPTTSGLSRTSARLVLFVRIIGNMMQEPQDQIDPAMVDATDTLMNAYSGDFDLGGNVMAVDLLGMSGEFTLSARAGYLSLNNRLFRVMTILLPLIVSDVWEQVP